MPEEIELADGTKREVPTAEELESLNQKVAKQSEVEKYFSSLKKDLGVKEGGSLTERIKEINEDVQASNVENVRRMRESLKAAKKALKEKGVEMNDDGQVTDKPTGVSEEQARKLAEDATLSAIQNQKRTEALSQFNSDEQKQIEPLLNKAMALGGTLEENLSLVTSKLFPGRERDIVKDSFYSSTGRPPTNQDKGQPSDTAIEIGAALGVNKEKLDKGGKITSPDEL